MERRSPYHVKLSGEKKRRYKRAFVRKISASVLRHQREDPRGTQLFDTSPFRGT